MAQDLTDRLRQALADRYRVEREVGAGGMATVYLAEDIKHRRKVAVKVLRPELAATLGPERFVREIEIAAQLQHPHILPLLDSGDADGFLYYVMPFVEGESLRDRLARQGELPIHEAGRILAEVVDALAYAHDRGVVHRDVKPDNVMLSGRHALVTDFGVAKAVSEATGRQQLTTAGVALGTPAYMAPEQAAADPHIDHRADIYAVGAMGYELLTGRPPFVGGSPQQVLAMHVTEPAQPVTQLRPTLPPALGDTIMRCLAKRPADRWQTAGELLGRLEGAVTPTAGMTPTNTAPVDAVSLQSLDWRGHPVRVGGLFLLASVAVLGVVYFLTIQLGLPDWVPWGALGLLGLGLPIMITTGLLERRRAKARATGMYTSGGEKPLQRWFTWRRAVMGGVMAFAILGVGTLGYTAMRLMGIGPVGTLVASGKLSLRDKVVVADFTNRTPDSTLSASVSEAFRIDLSQSQVMNLLTRSQMGEGLERMGRRADATVDEAIARELAQREGAKAYVLGEVSPVGRGFVLTARLLSVADGSELVAIRETADDDGQILAAIDRLSGRMRERIGESLKTIRSGEPLEQVTTASLEALRLYTQGNDAVDDGDFQRGIELLEQAIALDSGFAMAWRKLAVARQNARAGTSGVVEASTRAYQNRDRLPASERYHTTAYYHWNVEYDLDRVVDAYETILRANPDDATALNNVSLAYLLQRRYPDGERALRRAVELGGSTVFHTNLVDALLLQGRVEEARAALVAFEAAYPGNPVAAITRGLFEAREGRFDSAGVLLSALTDTRDPSLRLGVYQLLTGLAQSRGRLRQASDYRERGLALARELDQPEAVLDHAAAQGEVAAVFLGRPAEAVAGIDAALRVQPLASLEPQDRPYASLAATLALAGEPERARRLLAEYERAVPDGVRRRNETRHYAAGQVAMAEGRFREALAEFRAFRDAQECASCGHFYEGQAWDRLGEADSALHAYERGVRAPDNVLRVLNDAWDLARSYRRLGELYEARNDRARALEYYGKFVDLWREADPELQPAVRDVRARMAQLTAER